MVIIHCNYLNEEMIGIAHVIANKQQDVVRLVTPEATLEVNYDGEKNKG